MWEVSGTMIANKICLICTFPLMNLNSYLPTRINFVTISKRVLHPLQFCIAVISNHLSIIQFKNKKLSGVTNIFNTRKKLVEWDSVSCLLTFLILLLFLSDHHHANYVKSRMCFVIATSNCIYIRNIDVFNHIKLFPWYRYGLFIALLFSSSSNA